MSIDNRPIQDLDLNDADVNRILDKLEDEECDVEGSERALPRRFMRGTAVVTVLLESGAPSFAYRVRLRNITRQGVAFLSPDELTAGSRLLMELPTGPDLSSVEEHGVVTRCRAIEGTVHEIGVEFCHA